MNSTQEQPWSQAEGLDSMVAQELDFSNLLDLGDMDVSNFPIDQDIDNNPMQYAQQHSDAQFSNGMQGIQGGHAAHDFANQNFDMSSMGMSQDHSIPQGVNGVGMQNYGGDMGQQIWNGQHGQQQHSGQMQGVVYRQQNPIPPTPNSYDLHGGDPAHYQQQQMDAQARAYLEQQFQRQQKHDNFTPLVSPAVTPQESHFQQHVPEYAVPGTYFSPLTSPALQAQNAGRYRRAGHHTQPSTAGTSAAASPTGSIFDVDMMGADGLPMPEPARRRKTLRGPASRGSVTSLRQSPQVKPRKRKSESLSGALAEAQISHQMPQSKDSSGNESISPEPLSEALMGPPPRPGSTMQSPNLVAQHANSAPSSTNINGSSAAPATPASLMSIDPAQKANIAQRILSHSTQPSALSRTDMGLDDFVLPPSATSSKNSSTSNLASAEVTPRIAARKTPKLNPLSTASSAMRPGSATSSPAISVMTSPQSAGTPFFGKDGKARKAGNRGSISNGSSMLSPALRPKISPSIKPLLPDGGNLDATQQALLLASKSNYTHLLEGTLLPGVSYPDSLSSGLTSKRTSHKIAEQGRRNRINEALKEMQALLPSPVVKPKSGAPTPNLNGQASNSSDDAAVTPTMNGKSAKEKEKESSAAAAAAAASEAKAANSKAATVESAIEYIRTLQQERTDMENEIKRKDEEMNALRKRLAALEPVTEGKEEVQIEVVGLGVNGVGDGVTS